MCRGKEGTEGVAKEFEIKGRNAYGTEHSCFFHLNDEGDPGW